MRFRYARNGSCEAIAQSNRERDGQEQGRDDDKDVDGESVDED